MGQVFSARYNPRSNGILENFHIRLKETISKITSKFPEEWDIQIQAALIAYSEVPQGATGYTSSELMFGRPIRSPL